MALQSSGAISLNDIHVEAGGTSGTQCSLNDSDIRGLIGKASGAASSFSGFYGASGSLASGTGTIGNIAQQTYQSGYRGFRNYSPSPSSNVGSISVTGGSVSSIDNATAVWHMANYAPAFISGIGGTRQFYFGIQGGGSTNTGWTSVTVTVGSNVGTFNRTNANSFSTFVNSNIRFRYWLFTHTTTATSQQYSFTPFFNNTSGSFSWSIQ